MQNNNIIIRATSAQTTTIWGFTISQTGQLDFTGKLDSTNSLPDFTNHQQLDSSTYFSPTSYYWLRSEFCAEISVFIPTDIVIDSADTFAFITHIGAILVAIENNDTLLAADLFNRRKMIFEKFPNLCKFIFEPIAPYALFAWVYGGFNSNSQFEDAYKNGAVFDSSKDTSVFLYWAAKKALNPIPVKETSEEMFIRFFSDKNRKKVKFTINAVGTNHQQWTHNTISFLEGMPDFAAESDFVNGTSKVKDAKKNLFENLKVSVQAEPYNPADCNAIAVSAEDVRAKITGNGGMSKVGYLRSTAAAILRKAFPNKFAFSAKLARLNIYGQNPVRIRVEV